MHINQIWYTASQVNRLSIVMNLWDVGGFDVVFVFKNVQKCTDFSLACGLEVWLILRTVTWLTCSY